MTSPAMRKFDCRDGLENPARSAGQVLTELLSADRPTLLLVSGGSSFDILREVDEDIFSKKVTVGVLDERFSADPQVNNCAQLLATDFGRALADSSAELIDTRVRDGETFADLADRFNAALRAWVDEHPGGQVVATVGIGTDGHTAGIFPTETAAEFENRFPVDLLAVGYELSPTVNEHTKRVTVTPAFLTDALDGAIVFARGERKRAVLERLLNEDVPIHKMPAQILKHIPATLFSDQKL